MTFQDSSEKAKEDRKLCHYDYDIEVFREYFTSPFEQYEEYVGKRFKVVERLPDAEPVDEDSIGEDMYLIEFDDGTRIEAWGHEVCVLIYDNCK